MSNSAQYDYVCPEKPVAEICGGLFPLQSAYGHKNLKITVSHLGTENLLRAIRDMGHMGSIPEEFKGDRHLERLFEKSIFANMTQESQREYISRIMGEIDRKSTLNTAHEDGVQEGLEKGRKEGLLKGRSDEKISAARRMLAKGFDISDICDCTGLSPEEIKAIH